MLQILLDGKPVKTPARHALAAPTRALADAIAAEWHAQKDVIDPASMPLTRLANAVIDAVRTAPASGRRRDREISRHGLVVLSRRRAGRPGREAIGGMGSGAAWAREQFGARFVLAQGVVHVPQPREAIAAVRAAIPDDPWRLAAVSSITTLTGSALLALALAHGALDADAAWAAAHVDEDWQMSQWGSDELALERRAFREAEFQAAVTVLKLVK